MSLCHYDLSTPFHPSSWCPNHICEHDPAGPQPRATMVWSGHPDPGPTPRFRWPELKKNMEWIGIVRDLSIQICGMYETNQRFFCINMSPWGVEGTSVQNFLKINRDQSWNVTESWWLDVIGVFCEFIWRPYHIALKLSLAYSMSSTLLPRVIFHCSTWARV